MDFNEIISGEIENELILIDEDGKECSFELLDVLRHNENVYLVVVSSESIEKIKENDGISLEFDVIFLEVQFAEEELIVVNDEKLSEELFEIFKERNQELF